MLRRQRRPRDVLAGYPKRCLDEVAALTGRVELLGAAGPLPFTREAAGLVVTLPNTKPNEYAYVLKIRPA